MSTARFRPFGCNIHAHSDCSLDGGSSVKKIVQRAKELGQGHIVLTEHGNINSAAALGMYAAEAGIPFSHGIEVYLNPPSIPSISPTSDQGEDKRSYFHLTVLFKTYKAYQYFCKLTPIMESRAVIRYGERKPIINWEELEEIGSEIVLGTGCLVGFIQKWALSRQFDLAERAYQMCRSIVQPGCFFVELFPHCVTHEWQRPKRDTTGKITEAGKFVPNECVPGTTDPLDIQKVPNDFVLKMAAKYGDPVVVSEDSHFAYPAQKAVQDARLGNGQENWRFYTSYHMRTPDECFVNLAKMGISHKQMEEFVDNSYRLKDTLSGYKFLTARDRWVLPSFDGDTRQHLMQLIKKHGRMINSQEYIDRLKYEVNVLTKNKKGIDFLPYIFEVEDVSSWCKDNGVLMNLRGSAGGSLIAYLIGASITNPIKYDLPFERFITDGRINAGAIPDMDADFSNKSVVVANRMEKYGDRIVPLSTNMNMKLKNSIKDAERAILGRVRPETEIMCHRFPGIPQGPTEQQWLFGYEDKDTGEHIKGFWDTSDELRQYASDNPKIWEIVEECLGVMRNKGTHACGFLITPEPVQNYFPVTWVGNKANGQLCTAFDPKSLEWTGGIKYDFLGVKTLEVVRIATDLIRERHGVHLEWKEYEHKDEVYENIFHKADTTSVFQYNTNVIKPFLKATKPTSTKDLSALTALGRPGVLQAPAPDGSDRTCAEYYVAVASGEKPYYLHPDLEPILKETNGVILYQEQLLKTFTLLGGYTLEMAEDVRRAIAKKDKAKMELNLGKLKDALKSRGWSQKQADTLCLQLLASNRYSFNKAHSMSYAIVGYNTAYLKYFYPLEFWTAELTVFSDNDDKLQQYISILKDKILMPSISKSKPTEWVIEGDKIRAPLSVLNGLGEACTKAICENAPYVSVVDFAKRCSGRAVNRSVFTKLVFSGLFDELNQSYGEMLKDYWTTKKIKDPIPPELINMKDVDRFIMKCQLNKLSQEKLSDIVGDTLASKGWIKVPGNKNIPLMSPGISGKKTPLIADVSSAARILDKGYDSEIYMLGLIQGSSVETTKKGHTLLKVRLSDGSTEYEAVNWKQTSPLRLPKNAVVLIRGTLKRGYKVPVSLTFSSIEQVI